MSKAFVDLLLKEQLISHGDFSAAEEAFQKQKVPHLKYLQQHNSFQEQKLVEHFSKKYSIPSFDLNKYQIDPELVKILSAEDARRFRLIPLQKARGTLVVALADPTASPRASNAPPAAHSSAVETRSDIPPTHSAPAATLSGQAIM